MAYIGKIPATQGKDAGPALKIDDISGDFNGLTKVFDLKVNEESVDPHINNISIFLSGVHQVPGDSFSLSGSRIVFSAAPSASLDFHGAILGASRILVPDNATVETRAFTTDTIVSISGSLGANASTIRTLSSTTISGSFTAPSSSLASRITTAESELGNTLISSSAQIAQDISGSRDATSISGSRDAASISGSLGANAGVIRTLSAVTVSGSRDAASISGSRDAASISGSLGANAGVIRTLSAVTVSGSRDAASISGSFGNQRVGTTDDVKFANITGSNNISASGNLSITGNVDVDGTSNFAGNVTLQNDLVVTGRIDAEEIHTTFISSSITQATGSNLFGDSTTDSHQFTGSVDISGSLRVSDGNVVVSDTLTATNIGAFTAAGAIDFDNQNMTNVDIDSGVITGITDLTVADGGTGVSTLTDGGVLLGSGTSAITAMAVLTDGQMIVGDGTTDPVAESGATLRTSIGVGTTDDVKFANITGSNVSASVSKFTTATIDNITGNTTSSGDFGADGDLYVGGRITGSSGATFVDSVGIGSSSPTAKLDVNGGAVINGDTIIGRGGNQKGKLTIQSRTGTATRKTNAIVAVPYNDVSESICMIGMDGQAGNNEMHIGSNTGDFMSPTFIDFFTATSVTNQTNNRVMRITSDQKVGIGTDSPVSKIDVRGASSTIALNTSATSVFTLDPPDVSNGTYLFGDGSSGGDQVQILAVNDSAANLNEYAGIGFAMKTSGNTVVTLAGVAGIKENDTDGSGGDVGALAFGTRASGDFVKERMRITSTGKLGISTTFGENIASTGDGNLTVRSSDQSNHYNIVNVWQHSNTTANIEQRIGWAFGDDGGAEDAFNFAGYVGIGKEGTYATGATRDSYMSFAVALNNTVSERMRIASDGKVGIGTTGPGEALHVYGGAGTTIKVESTAGNDAKMDYQTTTTKYRLGANIGGVGNDTFSILDMEAGGGTERLRIKSDGEIDGNFNDTSDRAQKENIKDLTNTLEGVKALNPSTFNWIEDKYKTDKLRIGFIAQDVEAQFPELVDGKEGEKSISTIGLVSVLTKTVQELIKRIEHIEKTCKCMKED